MCNKRNLYWLWLICGTMFFVWDAATGCGIDGLLLYWQIETFGAMTTFPRMALAVLFVIVPIMLLARDSDRGPSGGFNPARGPIWGKRLIWIGFAFACVAGACYFRTTLLPDARSITARVSADDTPAGQTIAEQRAVLVGVPQKAYSLRYNEFASRRLHRGVTWSHNFVPVTEPGWTPGRPVRFLVDTRGNPISAFFSPDSANSGVYASWPGLLLRDELPGYVRWGLKKKGLIIADDVMVLSSRSDFGRVSWYVCAGLCAIGAFMSFVLGLTLRRT